MSPSSSAVAPSPEQPKRRRAGVLIEGHRGLLICTGELIALRGERGRVAIKGRKLQIEAMREDAMLIRGEMDRIEWED